MGERGLIERGWVRGGMGERGWIERLGDRGWKRGVG